MAKQHLFGKELRKLRNGARKTLHAVSKQTGMTLVYISQIERGERPPPKPVLVERLLKAIDAESELERMQRLAITSRRRVDFELDENPEAESVLLAFKRKFEEGKLTSKELSEIESILKKED